jgi:nicotinate-nucleotide adenylyltransferase
MPRTLVLGGTFNPIHVGHLRAAIEVAEVLGFDHVELIPSFAPRHKDDTSLLRFDLRVALLQVATAKHDRYHINDIEKYLPVPSITFHTLEALSRKNPASELHFLLGDREFLKLHRWINGPRVVDLAHIVVACRTDFKLGKFASDVADAWPASKRVDAPSGVPLAFELRPGRRAVVVPLPRIEVSSSLVRDRWRQGRSLLHLVPDGVIELLERHREEVTATWSAANSTSSEQALRQREAAKG